MTDDGLAAGLDNSDEDGFTHLVPGGMLEKDIIEVIGSERMATIEELQKSGTNKPAAVGFEGKRIHPADKAKAAYTFGEFKVLAGNDKQAL